MEHSSSSMANGVSRGIREKWKQSKVTKLQ